MAVAVSTEKRRRFPWGRPTESTGTTQLSIAWVHFRKRRTGMAGLVVLAVMLVLSLIVPQISPFDVTKNQTPLMWNKPMGTLDPNGYVHLFGTDSYGRDLLTVLFWALRITMSVALPSALAATVIGCALGALAGYLGGKVDAVVMRFTDIMLTLPIIPAFGIFAPIFRQLFQPISDDTSTLDQLNANLTGSLFVTGLVLALFGWQGVCRVTRASVLSLRQQEFVEASRALGASNTRIIFRHLLPNAAGPVLVAMTFALADFIIGLSILSYIDAGAAYSDSATGVGTLSNGTGSQPSLGTLIALGQFFGNLYTVNLNPFESVRAYMVFLPALCIVLMTLSINYIGDALRYSLDPRRMQ
ncbi:MAG TPA: ABC transporter permease [Chloroflexia bacterium]|jgi:peptide/nickel transport system permease protein